MTIFTRFIKTSIKKSKTRFQVLTGNTYKKHNKEVIVFVLSTGRCGSTSITDMFNQHPKFIAFHEAINPLIQFSTELAENPYSQKDVYLKLNRLFANRIWEAKKGQIIVHSDHRLWNLAPYLATYFPKAYFIHLIRNPYDSVRSYLQRNWYSDEAVLENLNIFDKYRLYGTRVNDKSNKEWMSFDQIDKCLWYWNYVNRNIFVQLSKLDNRRHSYVKLENLDETLKKLLVTNFNIEKSFEFEKVLKNQSTMKFKERGLERKIRNCIYRNSKSLFLKYYPEFN